MGSICGPPTNYLRSTGIPFVHHTLFAARASYRLVRRLVFFQAHHSRVRDQAALTALTSLVRESLASPKNMTVFGPNIRSLSMPAKPGRMDLFMKMMFLAWSAFRIGIP